MTGEFSVVKDDVTNRLVPKQLWKTTI